MDGSLDSTHEVFTEGSEYDRLHRLLLWAVDVLDGDKPQSDSITDHGMVDADARKHTLAPPEVYLAKMRGATNADLNKEFDLVGLPSKLRSMLDRMDDPMRKGVLLREIAQAEVRIQHSLAGVVDGVKKPSFEDLWMAVTGEHPMELSALNNEILALRAHMMALLVRDGVLVTNPRTLHSHLENWEKSQRVYGISDSEEIGRIIDDGVRNLFDQFKTLARRVPALAPFVDQLSIDHYQLNVKPDMNFDAGLSYIGGESNGKPTGATNFEWNAGRPATREDILYISAHETVHMINAFLMDLQRRARKLGPESAILTMSSSRAGNEEGLAQTTKELIAGGSLEGVIQNEGIKMGIVMLQDQLQDIARMVASLGWNRDFTHLDVETRRLYLHEMMMSQLLQTRHIADKYMGLQKRFWRELPGGQMYSLAYYYGSRAYRGSIDDIGPEATLAIGTHTQGLVDLQAFRQRVQDTKNNQ